MMIEDITCGCSNDRSGQSCRGLCDVGCALCHDDQAMFLIRGVPVCLTCSRKPAETLEDQLIGDCGA